MKIQVVQEGRFLRENLGSGRTKNLRQEPFHDFVGVCWKLGSFYPKKHRLRANVRICAEQSLGGWSSSWLWNKYPQRVFRFFFGKTRFSTMTFGWCCSIMFPVFSCFFHHFPQGPKVFPWFPQRFQPNTEPGNAPFEPWTHRWRHLRRANLGSSFNNNWASTRRLGRVRCIWRENKSSHIHSHVYWIYIYIYRERERIYIYIYGI